MTRLIHFGTVIREWAYRDRNLPLARKLSIRNVLILGTKMKIESQNFRKNKCSKINLRNLVNNWSRNKRNTKRNVKMDPCSDRLKVALLVQEDLNSKEASDLIINKCLLILMGASRKSQTMLVISRWLPQPRRLPKNKGNLNNHLVHLPLKWNTKMSRHP